MVFTYPTLVDHPTLRIFKNYFDANINDSDNSTDDDLF